MECKNKHFRQILLFIFVKARKRLRFTKRCDVYGVNCLTEHTCQNSFQKFRSGDFSLKDEKDGQPSEVDDDIMKAIIESNRHITVREIAK